MIFFDSAEVLRDSHSFHLCSLWYWNLLVTFGMFRLRLGASDIQGCAFADSITVKSAIHVICLSVIDFPAVWVIDEHIFKSIGLRMIGQRRFFLSPLKGSVRDAIFNTKDLMI